MTEASRQLFAPNGELLKSGEIFRAPNLVNVLDQFAKNDLRPIMELFQQEFSEPGGLVTPKDLEELSPKTTHPVHVHAGPFDIYLSPPPASGGLLVGFGLKLLEELSPQTWSNPKDKALALIAAMATTQKVRTSTLDPLLHDHHDQSWRELENFLSEEALGKWRQVYQEALKPMTRWFSSPRIIWEAHISVPSTHRPWLQHCQQQWRGIRIPGSRDSAMANNFMGEEDLHPNGFHQMPAGSVLTP